MVFFEEATFYDGQVVNSTAGEGMRETKNAPIALKLRQSHKITNDGHPVGNVVLSSPSTHSIFRTRATITRFDSHSEAEASSKYPVDVDMAGRVWLPNRLAASLSSPCSEC